MIAIGSTLNQRFTLDKELGRGGMGAVYRATDLVLGRNVAIKVLKELTGDEVGKRIRLEAQILARLSHENVVRLYDFGVSEGLYYLVMEEVDGPSLSKRWRNLPPGDRLRIGAEVADALDYAHHQGVIHRDVKPANVLLSSTDHAKLSDFGLSMMAEAQKEDIGQVRGTPHYMSPEQARGKRLDHRTDLYSLGVMLYECVTGSLPFTGQSLAVIAQHVNAEPASVRSKNPNVSASLEALILSMMAKDPSRRPPSGRVVAQRLREELASESETGSETVALPPRLSDAGLTEGPLDLASPTIQRGPADVPTSAHPPADPTARLVGVPWAVDGKGAPRVIGSGREAPAPVGEMIHAVLDEPIALSPDERYLAGHYLAYLLGGSRRRGLFLRRPNDPRNADRGRLMLAMTWLSIAGDSEANVAKAAELLGSGLDVRPALNPVVVAKYLLGRDSPAKRKRFRGTRKKLQEASDYAQKRMLDVNGVLNPGLMPQSMEDLRRIAPDRDEVDDELAERWNRVAEVWRSRPDFRASVLKYATQSAHRDPLSEDLWPEVVYPLIERARWQREFRPRHEALWDYLSSAVLRAPDAGVRFDRMIVEVVPPAVAEELDWSVAAFSEDPRLADDGPAAEAPSGVDRLAASLGDMSMHDLSAKEPGRGKHLVRPSPPDPYRFTQGELRELWKEALSSLGKSSSPGSRGGHKAVSVGPYRLAVVPSVRGRSASQIALQGMPNKQVEMLTPSLRGGGSSGKPVLAVWIYQDASAVIAYLDFKGGEKYILWHAPTTQQHNFELPADLNHMLFTVGLEVPDQLDRALSKRFRPRSAG